MQPHISFSVSDTDLKLITKYVSRIRKLERGSDGHRPRHTQDWRMDLSATHANGNPLDFAKLLAFDDFNFMHDCFGICACLDRSTGRLTKFFSPRCSARLAELQEAA
jgi:hypothetical protein